MGATLSAPVRTRRPGSGDRWPLIFLAVMLLLLLAVPTLLGGTAPVFSVFNAAQSFAGLGLVALALGLTMIIGEFDLSVVGTYALGGMLAVKFGAENPFLGALIAVVGCALFGAIQGLAIAKLRVNSMAVTLAGYLVALGAAGTIGDNKSQPFPNFEFTGTFNAPIAGVLSLRSLITLVIFVIAGLLLLRTRAGRDMRAAGGGRRAARTAGVRVDLIVVVTFAASAGLSALGGTIQSYGVATATSNPGLFPLIFAVTACLLGGVALTGGQGTPVGIFAGALGLCFLSQLFTDLASPQFMVSLVTGALLVAVTLAATPALAQWRQRLIYQKDSTDSQTARRDS